MKKFICLLALAVSGCAAPEIFDPPVDTLRPFEAVYEVRLVETENETGPLAARGLLTHRLEDTCDGWSTYSHVSVDLTFGTGVQIASERTFEAWERKDGRVYRFSVLGSKNGKRTEKFSGSARIGTDGRGKATYKFNNQYTLDLPEGTLLPLQFSSELLRRAENGQTSFTAPVFNGQTVAGPRLISTVIGGTREGSADKKNGVLTERPWLLDLAFFNLNRPTETPAFELRTLFHETGLTETVSQDFGDFTIAFALKGVNPLPERLCL